jgi:hypothetical protein
MLFSAQASFVNISGTMNSRSINWIYLRLNSSEYELSRSFYVYSWTSFQNQHRFIKVITSSLLTHVPHCVTSVPPAVKFNVAIFWDIAPCIPYANRRFGGMYFLHILSGHLLHHVFWLGWFLNLKMEAIISSETSVHIQTTWSYIYEDNNSDTYRCENQKSCNVANL